MFESVLPRRPPERVLIAVPPWYDCAAAAARLAALLEANGVPVETVEAPRLDAMLWGAPDAYALVFHPSAEDAVTVACLAGDAPSEAVAAWTRHGVALALLARRHGERVTLLDPHAALDDDALAATLAGHLALPLEADHETPRRSRKEDPEAAGLRFLCRLAVLETPAVAEIAAHLRPHALPLWSAPVRTTVDEAAERLRALEAGTAAAARPAESGSTAWRARFLEAEAQKAQLVEQIALLQEAVGASLFDGETLQHQTIYAHDGLTHPAFYQPERRRDGMPLRWLGNQTDAVLPTDVSRTRAVRVDVEIAVAISRAALDAFHVTCDGAAPRSVEVQRREDGTTIHSATFAPPATPDPLALVRIGLHAPVVVDTTGRGDPRRLAVAIHKVEVWQVAQDESVAAGIEVTAETLDLPAFYALERHPSGVAYRWMGQADTADIALANAPHGPVRVEIHMPVVLSRRLLNALTVRLGGLAPEEDAVLLSGDGGAVRTLTFPAAPEGAAPSAGHATLSLRLTETGRPGTGDERTLGVAIERILVRPA